MIHLHWRVRPSTADFSRRSSLVGDTNSTRGLDFAGEIDILALDPSPVAVATRVALKMELPPERRRYG
jgi:hypothetical protein